MKGTMTVPFSFSQMEGQIPIITQKLESLLAAHPEHFLVEIRVKPTNNIKIFIDGDTGIMLSELITYNRKLYRQIEEDALYPDGNFSLEVSSPGVDEPLKLLRQYKKNIGRFVEVTFNDGRKQEGKLLEVRESDFLIEWEEGKVKKKETKQETIIFEGVKSTTVQVRF